MENPKRHLTEVERSRLIKAVQDLREHFDTVQVFVSLEDDDGVTALGEHGAGNHLAREFQAMNMGSDLVEQPFEDGE